MCQHRSQCHRKHLSHPMPLAGAPLGTQSNHRGDCPSDLPTHLDYFASRGWLCGTRSCRPRKFETSTHVENDPATPEPRLSRRTAGTEPSISSEEFSTLWNTVLPSKKVRNEHTLR